MAIHATDPKDIKCEWLKTRASTREETIEEYAAAMKAGAKFPAITVFQNGDGAWGVGGHRYEAAKRSGKRIDVDFKQGGAADALELSAAQDESNGLRRTNADKKAAIISWLNLQPDLSNRAIAEKARVGDHLVASVRESWKPKSTARTRSCNKNTEKTRVGKDGKRRPAKAKPAAEPKPPKPGQQKGDPRVWDKFESSLVQMQKAIAAIAANYPHSNIHRAALDSLDGVYTTIKDWKRATR